MSTCCVEGCGKSPVVAKGLCRTHYGRLHRTGSVEREEQRRRRPMEDRFWEKVEKSGIDDCWIWVGQRQKTGYGIISRGGKSEGREMAHRYSYMLRHGPIPEGKWVLHSCDNPSCVNPAHLRAGTAKENTADAILRNRAVPPPILRGASNARSKLTIEDVELIRANPEKTGKYFARIYNVAISTILRVRSGSTWKEP